MQKSLSIIPVLIFIIVITACAQKERPMFQKFTHIQSGDTLPYSVLEPRKADPGEKVPLVIFLHGAGERGRDNTVQTKHIEILYNNAAMNKFPAIVVAPQCPKKEMWSQMMTGKAFSSTPTRPMELFIEVLDKLMQEYPVDPSRIYVTGVSMGGYGTWDLLRRFPDRFAAGVPVCGGADPAIAPGIKHIPVWVFHGNEDTIVPPQKSREMVSALQKAGGVPGYTEYPGVDHASWNKAYKDPYLLTWLFRQKNDQPNR